MSAIRGDGRVFTIPAGAPFLKTFARALLAGEIAPGFPAAGDPLALASATIYTPTARAARALADAFVEASSRGAAVLPNIVPLGRFEAADAGAASDDESDAPGVAPLAREVTEIERRLTLSTLVRTWAASVRAAIAAPDDGETREAMLVGASLASAWSLAGDLGGLIDEFAIESIAWEALDTVVPEEFDAYWGITHRFLRIAVEAWPRHLAERGLVDRVAAQTLRVDAEIARLTAGPARGPIIVAGSTGANATTARLLAAIAATPGCAIVLPGLDQTLDKAAWTMLACAGEDGAEPIASHPQAILARLLRGMGVAREDVVALGAPPTMSRARQRLLSEALRPAETTDGWRALRDGGGLAEWLAGLDDVTLVEAAEEREEALCVAIKLRECVARGERAALVTPDRDIARRARAQLRRWSIDIDDSAGAPLARAPQGVLARLVFAAAADPGAARLHALLSHPLATFGRARVDIEHAARGLDIAVLRVARDFSLRDERVVATARQAATERGAHPNVAALDDEAWRGIEALLADARAAFAPLLAWRGPATIATWARLHAEALAATRGDAPAIDGDGRAECDTLLARLVEHGDNGGPTEALAYLAMFDRLLADTPVREHSAAPAALRILGLLEARLLDFDTVIVAGLDEGAWPPRARTDAFLNRAIRARLGMSQPERRLGQTAHDFSQLLGAPRVVIARALKRGGAPTVPSRFLQRLAALVGDEAWRACRSRGARLIALSRHLDVAERRRVAPPAPRPPLDLRPMRLSVTRVETLRRDPYAIYAEMILRLRPLDPIAAPLDMRHHGMALHDVTSVFAESFYAADVARRPSLPELLALAEAKFAGFLETTGFREFTWPRLRRSLTAYLDWERAQADTIARVHVEQSGGLSLTLSDGSTFDLVARADRIEQHHDGSARVLDFKSGRLPSSKEIQVGFAPQLVLEAEMIAKGAFRAARADDVSALYVKLGGPAGIDFLPVRGKDRSLDELRVEQLDGLLKLLAQLRDENTPYLSRPYPQFVSRFGVYDHLARVREWAAGAGEGDAT